LAAIQQTERRAARAARHAGHIPARVRRAVWKRDGQQCSFVSEHGRRCTEKLRLELDHVVPVARGGKSTLENLRVLCRAHNMFFATLAYGERFVKHKITLARSRASA
ncbi:MAG: HNH endonuclease, partial [Candidatus Eisenbacteria bacterium]|nr:HNH endonuclease [Candidatus Eisenbacteria bacterium]